MSVSLLLIINILAGSVGFLSGQSKPTCNQDLLDRSFVTQCGPRICESLLESDSKDGRPNEWPSSSDEIIHIVSSRAGDRFKVNSYKSIDRTDFFYEESHVNGTIFVDTNVKYQRILGFGTTLTDSAVTNVDLLPNDVREVLINDYFSTDKGLGLNLIKVPIGSTKFSFTNYVLEQPDISQLELSPYDTDHRIPIIRDALRAAGKFRNRIKILASSATAPAEYKDNSKMIHGGYLLRDKIADYANYLLSFVSAYKAQDIDIWSLILSESPVSVAQDKESNDTLNYNSMAMKPSDVVSLIREINTLRSKQSASEKFRMLMLGDSRAYIPVWADAILQDQELAKNVAGIAYVCSNKFAPYDNLAYVTRRYPNKYLLATQGSVNSPIKLGNWQYAENYATELINNLNYGSVGWIDFNFALNLEGGPVLSSRYKADAPVMVDVRRSTFYRNPMLYAIGHLSRYVKPGSIRVRMDFYSSAHMYAHQYAAFITPDNYLVAVIINNNIGPMPISIGINRRTKVQSLLATKSFNTFIFKL